MVNYSSTGMAYKGGSEGKTDKGGPPVVQGRKDCSLGTRRDTDEMRREGLREVSDTGDLGTARGSVTGSAKARGYHWGQTPLCTDVGGHGGGEDQSVLM